MKNLVIDRDAIRNNLNIVKSRARGVDIIADLSADAFGMGIVETARIMREEGVTSFAVSDPRDAERLRNLGFTDERLMMLRSTADSDEIRDLIELGVICTVGSYDAAVAINGIAEERHTVCEVQIKIDSGLGRYGFLPTETDKIASIFKYMPNLAVIGVFSTYSQSHKSERITRSEYETFKGVLDKLTQMGFEVGYTNIADSAALFKYDFGTMDAVRVGTALAGRVAGGAVPGLMKVGYIKAGVEEVGWFPKKHRIGGQTLKKPARLAVLSVGFYNGFGVNRPDYERRLIDILKARKRRPVVKLGGRKLRIIGNVGLQHTIVDVTDIECSVGDACYLDVDPVNVKGLQRTYISHEEK